MNRKMGKMGDIAFFPWAVSPFFRVLAVSEGLPENRALSLFISEKHFDDFLEVVIQFIQCRPLRMRPGETRHITHIEVGIRASFNDSGKSSHWYPPCKPYR